MYNSMEVRHLRLPCYTISLIASILHASFARTVYKRIITVLNIVVTNVFITLSHSSRC